MKPRKSRRGPSKSPPKRDEVDVTAAYLAGLPVDQVSDDQPDAKTDNKAGKVEKVETVGMRIIGGTHRGRSLSYSGDIRTRPMKDRVREAVFNLIGTDTQGAVVIDLFAGTGALALEALSRGARHAIMIERHYPTTRLISDNLKVLALEDKATVVFGDAFRWTKKNDLSADDPQYACRWIVFCAPPYEFYQSRTEDMFELLATWQERMPPGSLLVVESDTRAEEEFVLPVLDTIDADWESRPYPPAMISILEIPKIEPEIT